MERKNLQQQDLAGSQQDKDPGGGLKSPHEGSPSKNDESNEASFLDSPDKKFENRDPQNKGFVTTNGRQLSGNHDLDLNVGKALSLHRNGQQLRNRSNQLNNRHGSVHAQPGRILNSKNFVHQKTIPLNFMEDMKVGLGDGEKNLINFDGTSNGLGEQWFLENNFSVISGAQQNQIQDKLDADKILSDQKYFSSPEQSEAESGLAHALSPKGRRQFSTNNGDGTQIQDNPGPPKETTFRAQKRSLISMDNKMWNQGYIDDKFTERVDTDQDFMINPQFYQSANSIGTKIGYNTGNQDMDQLVPRLNFFGNQNKTALGTKMLGDGPLSQQDLRQMLHHQQPNADILIAPVQWKRKNKTLNGRYSAEDNDDKNDESDVEKKLDVDYTEEVKLDERRFGLGIVSKLMANINQNAVMDDSFFLIVEKNSLEKIDSMTGRCVRLRQEITRLMTNINHTALFIITSRVFDGCSLLVIVANSFSLAMQDPTAATEGYYYSMLDIGFLAFYTTEMALKITGLGFVWGKTSYLRDYWNMLDFTIVVTSYIPYILTSNKINLSSLRSFRVLRPLRTISGVPGLKVIVQSLLASMKLLKDTLILLAFFFLVFAIAGLQVFSGALKKQCFEIETGAIINNSGLMFCGGSYDCPSGYFCGKSNSNPAHNFLNFDNILYSLMNCFVSETLESWTYIMKYLQRSLSFYVFCFSVPLAFVGSFVLQNLTIAVVSAQYQIEFKAKAVEQAAKKVTKKRKAILDFDNMDEAELKKFKDAQDATRKAVLKKWKGILFIKQRMRRFVEESRMRKQQENKKLTQTGFDRLSMLESPSQYQKTREGVIFDKETNYEPDASSRQQLTKYDADISSVRIPQHSQSDEKLKNSRFTIQKNQNFKINKQDIISEDDDEYRTEPSHIHGRSLNVQKSAARRSSPVSPFLDKQKMLFNDFVEESAFKEFNQKQDKQNGKMILLDSPEKTLKMHGMAGLKYVVDQNQPQNDANQSEISQVYEPYQINQEFFINFINLELPDIEKQFTDTQLAQIAHNLDIKEANLFPMIEEMDYNELSDNSIQSLDALERLYISQHNVHRKNLEKPRLGSQNYTTIKGASNRPANTIIRQQSKKQYTNDDLSTSGENLKLTANLVMNNNNKVQEQQVQSSNDIVNSNEYQLASSISELTFHRGQTAIQRTDSFKHVQKQNKTTEGDKNENGKIVKDSPPTDDKMKRVIASNKWQNESTTLIIGNNNATMINETLHTNKQVNTKNPDEKKQTSKVMPWGAGFYGEDREFKLAGPNTIFRRDMVPVENSLLNSNFLVGDDIGIHKKIYLRNDKFDFTKPAEEIFEKRERQQAQIELEKTIKEQTEYLKDWKIKPYQRRAELQPQVIMPDEDQLEYLTSQGLDHTDLAAMVQSRYNEPYLSNLYVTGTLSVTLLYKKQSLIEHRTRKLQNNNFAIVEHYDQQASRSQSMNSSNISRRSTMKSSMSMSVGLAPIDIQKLIVLRTIRSQQISQTQSKGLKQSSMIGGASTSRQAAKDKTLMNEPESGNTGAQKKAKNLAKQAMKNQKFQQKLIIHRVNKDAMRSSTFKTLIEKRKSRKNKSQIIEDLDEHITDDDGDEDNDEIPFQETEDYIDDYIDRDFDNTLEVKKAKKQAVFTKRPIGLWSGQDILEDFDPRIALNTAQRISDARVWPQGPYGVFKAAQGYIRTFVRLGIFDNFLTLCVFTNVILLTLDKYPSDPETDAILAQFNTVFTYIFISEMSLKLIGLGPVRYMKDRMNYLDGLVVILSIVEILMSRKGASGSLSAFKSIRIFRIFRILRIARLLRALKSMQVILGVLVSSMSSFIYLLMLMFLFLFIYTLLGMQLFGGTFNFDENDGDIPGVPRMNYDSFHQAFQAVFDVLTVENWFSQLYDGLRSGVAWPITILFLFSWIFLGNWMILNLFLAILLEGFSIDQVEEDPEETEHMKQAKSQAILMEELDQKEGEELIIYYRDKKPDNKNQKGPALNLKKKGKKKKRNKILLDESFEFEKENLKKKIQQMKDKHRDFEGVDAVHAVYFLPKTSSLRVFFYKLQHHAAFEYFILVLIILSSGKLIMDTYIYSRPSTDMIVRISAYLDYFFTSVFACEALIKTLALGFCNDKGSYLREFWNQLDFGIVCISLLDVALVNVNTPALKVMKIFRALRPLRFISHNRDMKTLVNTLAQSIGAILNVGVVCVIVWSMFAILGVNLFQGKLFFCNGGTSPYEFITAEQCYAGGGQWTRFMGHFDNFVAAIISLFTVSTFENWPDILHSLEDINDTELGPIRNNSPLNAYFLVAFILIGVFIFLNLFIGVLFMKFEEVQQEEKEATHLTDAQMKWLDIMKMIVNAKPDLETMHVPKELWRKKVHRFVNGDGESVNKFEMSIMAVIVLNMVLMTMNYETAGTVYNSALEKVNYFFTGIFIIEATLKLIALGWAYYKSGWNLFDFFIVSTSIFDIVISNIGGSSSGFLKFGPQVIRVLRVLRVSRLFRLVTKYKGLAALVQTLQFSMPQLMNVFALVGLTYFIFAIVANFLFRDVTAGTIIDEITNFSNFGYSYLTLVRMSTGEDWNYIMYDCSQTNEQRCIGGVSCGSVASQPFFIFFMLLQQNIILNLFVLVLCQQFEQYYLKDNNILSAFKKDLETFKQTWTKFTSNQRCIKIKDTQMIAFFISLKSPMGYADVKLDLNKKQKESFVTAEVVEMEIDKDEYGFVYFNELVYKTMRRVYGHRRVKNLIIVQAELETMLKIEQIQNKFAKKSRIAERQEIGSVNPFLLKMFMNISFKAWSKIYADNQVIRDRLKEEGESYDKEELLSPERQEASSQEQIEDDYYYQTEEDVSYYSDGEDESESDYDDEDEDDGEDDDDDAEKSQSQKGEDQHEFQLSSQQMDQFESKTERVMEKNQIEAIGFPHTKHGSRLRENSGGEFKMMQKDIQDQEREKDLAEKLKNKKKRKATILMAADNEEMKSSAVEKPISKGITMKEKKQKTQLKIKSFIEGESGINVNGQNLPVEQNEIAKKDAIEIVQQVAVMSPTPDDSITDTVKEDNSGDVSSGIRLKEASQDGIISGVNNKIIRMNSDGIGNKSEEQEDERSQLIEADEDGNKDKLAGDI